jgi:hypothetical protein
MPFIAVRDVLMMTATTHDVMRALERHPYREPPPQRRAAQAILADGKPIPPASWQRRLVEVHE